MSNEIMTGPDRSSHRRRLAAVILGAGLLGSSLFGLAAAPANADDDPGEPASGALHDPTDPCPPEDRAIRERERRDLELQDLHWGGWLGSGKPEDAPYDAASAYIIATDKEYRRDLLREGKERAVAAALARNGLVRYAVEAATKGNWGVFEWLWSLEYNAASVTAEVARVTGDDLERSIPWTLDPEGETDKISNDPTFLRDVEQHVQEEIKRQVEQLFRVEEVYWTEIPEPWLHAASAAEERDPCGPAPTALVRPTNPNDDPGANQGGTIPGASIEDLVSGGLGTGNPQPIDPNPDTTAGGSTPEVESWDPSQPETTRPTNPNDDPGGTSGGTIPGASIEDLVSGGLGTGNPQPIDPNPDTVGGQPDQAELAEQMAAGGPPGLPEVSSPADTALGTGTGQ